MSAERLFKCMHLIIVMIHASKPWDFIQGVDILGISEMAAGASFRYLQSVAPSAHALTLSHTDSLTYSWAYPVKFGLQ